MSLRSIAEYMLDGSAYDCSVGRLILRELQAHALVRMTLAASEFVGVMGARELCNNVASVLLHSDDDPYLTAYSMLGHRVDNLGLHCGDVAECARAMQRAWDGECGVVEVSDAAE